jgi:hypothetical protein
MNQKELSVGKFTRSSAYSPSLPGVIGFMATVLGGGRPFTKRYG